MTHLRRVAIGGADENPMAADQDEYQRRFKAIQDGFIAELPAKLTQIEQHWRALGSRWDTTHAQDLYIVAHRLAGAGETFGFPELSRRARDVDQQLAAHAQHGGPDAAQWAALERALDALAETMRTLVDLRG